MPEFCRECCGEILTVEERDLLRKSFEETHQKGANRFGMAWVSANQAAIAAAYDLEVDSSDREIKSLLTRVCYFILVEFEKEIKGARDEEKEKSKR